MLKIDVNGTRQVFEEWIEFSEFVKNTEPDTIVRYVSCDTFDYIIDASLHGYTVSLSQLDYELRQINNPEILNKLVAYLSVSKFENKSICEIILMLDEYKLLENINNKYDLGKYIIKDLKIEKLPKKLYEFFDFSKYAEHIISSAEKVEKDCIIWTPVGYLCSKFFNPYLKGSKC